MYKAWFKALQSVQFSSVAQLCLTLCNVSEHFAVLMDCSTPGLPVHHQLPEITQTHVHRVGDAIQPSHPDPFSSHLQSFPASGSFPKSQFFASGGQSIGVSASASVLPMNIQDWFPLGLTGLIFFQSTELSRVFSITPGGVQEPGLRKPAAQERKRDLLCTNNPPCDRCKLWDKDRAYFSPVPGTKQSLRTGLWSRSHIISRGQGMPVPSRGRHVHTTEKTQLC